MRMRKNAGRLGTNRLDMAGRRRKCSRPRNLSLRLALKITFKSGERCSFHRVRPAIERSSMEKGSVARRIGNWSTGIVVAVAVAIVINHLVYGFGCWGLQSGGRNSARLYFLLCLLALLTCGVAAWIHFRREDRSGWLRALAVIGAAVAAGILFYTDGWTTFTSIHHQGMEKLVPVGAAWLAALYGGLSCRWTPSAVKDADAPDRSRKIHRWLSFRSRICFCRVESEFSCPRF